VVILYGTGEGVPKSPVSDGAIDPSPAPVPAANITATVGGMPATVLYAGGSPGLVAGLLQVNLAIPSGLMSCSASGVPVVLSSGSQTSQTTVTIPVKKSASCPADLSFQSATINGQASVKGLGTYSATVSIKSNGDGTYTVNTLALLPTLGYTLIFPSATISGNTVTATQFLAAGSSIGFQTPTAASFSLTIMPETPLGGTTFVMATGVISGTSSAGSVTANFTTTGMYDGFIQ
jgi:hypothetical protein